MNEDNQFIQILHKFLPKRCHQCLLRYNFEHFINTNNSEEDIKLNNNIDLDNEKIDKIKLINNDINDDLINEYEIIDL